MKCTQLIDALSRAFLLEMVQEEFKREIESEKYIHLMSKTVHVTDRKLAEIKGKITRDNSR